MYVLKKETKRRNSSLQTGGGSPKKIHFSPLEENLLEFLTPEAAGMANIPQGGIYLNENQNIDSQRSNISNTIEMEYFEEKGNENMAPNITQRASVSLPKKLKSIFRNIKMIAVHELHKLHNFPFFETLFTDREREKELIDLYKIYNGYKIIKKFISYFIFQRNSFIQ